MNIKALLIALFTLLAAGSALCQNDQAIDYVSISYMCKGNTSCKSNGGVDEKNHEGDSWCIENNHPTKSISFKHTQSVEVYENGQLTKVFPESGDGYWNTIEPGRKFIVSCKREEVIGRGYRHLTRYGQPVILKAHFE